MAENRKAEVDALTGPGEQVVEAVCQRDGCWAEATFELYPDGRWCLDHVPSDSALQSDALLSGSDHEGGIR